MIATKNEVAYRVTPFGEDNYQVTYPLGTLHGKGKKNMISLLRDCGFQVFNEEGEAEYE